MIRTSLFSIFAALALAAASSGSAAPALELKPGDHIAIIGNGLGDRLQHDGTLETLIYGSFPTHDLVIRNLAFSGDDVGGFIAKGNASLRHRSKDVYSNDEWLTRVKADVLFV